MPLRIGTDVLRHCQCSRPGPAPQGTLWPMGLCESGSYRRPSRSRHIWLVRESSVLTQASAPTMSSLASYQRSRANPAVWLMAVRTTASALRRSISSRPSA
ncbi:Uncharacterised protein [Bordetella pertussis]|nr:Uncharacterised protein [Bordetella pertussis]CFT97508.1 Uncharacterised protein [Bordetella pertussis]